MTDIIPYNVAQKVASNLKGLIYEAKNNKGWKILVPYKRDRDIIVRLMNKGSGGKEYPYYRITVDKRGAMLPDGSGWSNDLEKTHIKFSDNYLEDIERLVSIIKEKGL